MEISKASEEQINEIMELVAACVEDMEARETYQWDDRYPTRDIIIQDIKDQNLLLMSKEGNIVGIMVITEEQDIEYEDVEWADREGKILVVHRLAVHPDWQGQGIAKDMMDYAEEYALGNGYSSIRLDTYSGNPLAIRFYEKRGYQKRGRIYLPPRSEPYYCYEKILTGHKVR